MSEDLDLSRMIAYCAHLGMLYSDRRLRGAGYDVTPVQSRVLVYLTWSGSCTSDPPPSTASWAAWRKRAASPAGPAPPTPAAGW